MWHYGGKNGQSTFSLIYGKKYINVRVYTGTYRQCTGLWPIDYGNVYDVNFSEIFKANVFFRLTSEATFGILQLWLFGYQVRVSP